MRNAAKIFASTLLLGALWGAGQALYDFGVSRNDLLGEYTGAVAKLSRREAAEGVPS